MSVVSRLSVVPFFLCAFLMSYSYGQIAAQFDDCGSPGSSTVPYCIDSHVVERLRLLLLQLQDDIVFMACNASCMPKIATAVDDLTFVLRSVCCTFNDYCLAIIWCLFWLTLA